MALNKLTIIVENPKGSGSEPVFDGGSERIKAQFNPSRLSLNKQSNWQQQNPDKRDVPESQFTNAEPATLGLDLFFDTYDTPDDVKQDVRKSTQQFAALLAVNPQKHRPPVCKLSWGTAGVFFQGVLQQLDQQFTLFAADGTPVRATLKCTFKEWRTNVKDRQMQGLQSADVAKVWTVKRGQTLSGIAAEEYGDPRLWRPIARANDIDDPRLLTPGTILMIPALTERKD